MRRLLVSSLLLTSARRYTAFLFPDTFLHSRNLTKTCRSLNYRSNMEQPFEKMAQKGEPKCNTPTEAAAPKKEEQDLPKLSAKDFRVYNRMAEHMDMFHEHFRQTWNTLYKACEAGKRPGGMSIRSFLNTAEEFCHHLTMHHTIEEQHIFPVLARKQPAFRKELELLEHHKRIHEGLEKLEEYLAQCRSGEKELRLAEMKEKMDVFGAVLWEHLDAEVHELRAENMRKYWTLEEMRRMPM